jgi:hypothetical protein
MCSSRGREPHVQLVHHSRVDPVLRAKRHHNGSALKGENIFFCLSLVKRKTGRLLICGRYVQLFWIGNSVFANKNTHSV